jgi:hypothetical protein
MAFNEWRNVPMTFYMAARKPKTYKLDEALIEALDRLAASLDDSTGSYVEKVLWKHCQGMGVLPIDKEPPKDQRGGKRIGSGRPKKTDTLNPDMSPEELEAAAQSLGEAFSGSVVDLEEFERTMADRDGSEGGAIDG